MMCANEFANLPSVATVILTANRARWLSVNGELEELCHDEVTKRLQQEFRPIICNAPATARRLEIKPFKAFDVLELFAFISPAQLCIPTPLGIADAIGLDAVNTTNDDPLLIRKIASQLLKSIKYKRYSSDSKAIASTMARDGWLWGKYLLAALDADHCNFQQETPSGFEVWKEMKDWPEYPPPHPPSNVAIKSSESLNRLVHMLGKNAEERPGQRQYSAVTTAAFQPSRNDKIPHLVLAEAGTGVGKTKGYIAPASIWAEKNNAPVWISTYTRNLQHQINQELSSLYSDRLTKQEAVVIRKGRENYFCLLNFEEAVRINTAQKSQSVALGLMARWAAETVDGDVSGGTFPAWLTDLVGHQLTVGLTDRRGECIYSACPHYSRCFIESNIRRAPHAKLVVANHALVMTQVAGGQLDGIFAPTHYVFDEGHHVFDAADNVFSSNLNGIETAELRRWLRGEEDGSSDRTRGLMFRIQNLLGSLQAKSILSELLAAAQSLPLEGWQQRCLRQTPQGPTEIFLTVIRELVYNRSQNSTGSYSLEVSCDSPSGKLIEAASKLNCALGALERPINRLVDHLQNCINDELGATEAPLRIRMELMVRSIIYRALNTVVSWRSMLTSVVEGTPEHFVDWFSVERVNSSDINFGMNRHWVDPTIPFMKSITDTARGIIITSATMTDRSGKTEEDWHVAENLTGATHLTHPVIRAAIPSPFDYQSLARVIVVDDINKDDMKKVAKAYKKLFVAAGGGALGLFTAINRLRIVQKLIVTEINKAGLTLYSQHVDGLNLATLVDIFRAEKNACLLGTDAMRDGVDIPGAALRLLVFDRVPWPRPTLLHRARRKHFGMRSFDDTITRLKLKQAFGRLIRQEQDCGVFIMLDPQMPSRLAEAFPPNINLIRVGLTEAIATTRAFLCEKTVQKYK